MGSGNFIQFSICSMSFFFLLFFDTCNASNISIGQIHPGFQAPLKNFAENHGIFLISNNSKFGFEFTITQRDDVNLFQLTIVYMGGGTIIIVWSANRDSPDQISDAFKFDKSGNAFLERAGSVVWETGTANKGVSVMELQNSGNLVMFDDQKKMIWDSFSHPTDTLLEKQNFREGMKLVSVANSISNVSYFLEIKSGDMRLYADYATPQPYWSLATDSRKANIEGVVVSTAVIDGNSWKFLNRSNVLVWQLNFPEGSNENETWIAVLDSEGFITFTNLQMDGTTSISAKKIPPGSCNTPNYCRHQYYLCSDDNRCECPSFLSHRGCESETVISSPCNGSKTELVSTGDGVGYFALPFVQPSSITDLDGCKFSCRANCSCLALFFESRLGQCFMFDQVGGFQEKISRHSFDNFVSFIKVSIISGNGTYTNGNRGGTNKRFLIVIIISALIVLLGLLYGGHRYYRIQKRETESSEESSEEDTISESGSNNRSLIRFKYKDLQTVTNNFTVKLGKGGFGSVYQGTLADGTHIAVKKLEGVGQGKKEFKAEVNTIGCIHHLHLVRLRGFCTERAHRLLVYEYMGNGSLEKWIFKNNKGGFMLDWDTRYNIALGTAKGLAYLHEDCDVKIVHCDIKPENILLDDNYHAKVSDFGLAKLMTREQSHAFTTLRGTRGYLAPEWIKSYALSEKCDVYSYGMVLLEIIGGRKNYDPSESSEKFHFPSYAFKMMEDRNLKEILDSNLDIDEHDERLEIAIKVALWCIQEDMSQRPSMTRVVQMLERISIVPTPPPTSSGPSDCNSEAYPSTVSLSGPR